MAERLNLGDLIYRLGFENESEFLRELERLLDKAEDTARSGGAAGGRQFGDAFEREALEGRQQFGQSFAQSLGIGAIASFIGNALANAFSSAIGNIQQFVADSRAEFQSFQLSLNTLSASGITDLQALAQQISALSEESRVFSENQIGQALSELIKAGLPAGEAIEFVRRSINVARSEINTATGELGDLRSIALQLSDVMAGFGISIEDSARATDILAQGALDSKLSISELAAAIGPIGGLARTAGLSLEQTVSALALLRGTGLSAAESATQLRTVLLATITPAAQYRERMQELGLTAVKTDGSLRTLPELLSNIDRVARVGGRGLEFLSSVFGSYGVNAAISLARSRDALNQQAEALRGSEGAAKQFGDTMLRGVEETKNLERQLLNAKRAVGEQLQPALIALYRDVLPPIVAGFSQLVQRLSEFIQRAEQLQNRFSRNANIVRQQAADATYGMYTDPLRGLGTEQGIAIAQRQIAEQRRELEKLQTQARIMGATPLLQAQIEGARREIQKLESKLQELEAERQRLLRQEFRQPPARPAPPAQPPAPQPPAPPPPAQPQPPAQPSLPRPASSQPRRDTILEAVRNQTEALRDAQNRLKLAGGLEAALGSPQLLERYKNELNAIERNLQKISQRASTPEQKRAVNAALVEIQQAEQEIERARRENAERRQREQEKSQRERLEAARREAQLIAEQLAAADRAAAQIEEQKRERDREALEEAERLQRERIEAARREAQLIAEQLAAADRAAEEIEEEKRRRDREALADAERQAAALAAYERNAAQAALNAQKILAEGLPDEADLAEGIRGFIEQFDLLRIALATGQIDAEAFQIEVERLIANLQDFAMLAGREGNVQLFDAATSAAERLQQALERIVGVVRGTAILAPDSSALGKLPEDLQAASDFASEFQARIQSLRVALENLPDDPLGIDDWLADIDDELFRALDDLEERIDTLPPDDPELERLRELRDLLLEISGIRTSLTPLLELPDGARIPRPIALEANQDYRAGERVAGVPTVGAALPGPEELSQFESELTDLFRGIGQTFIRDLLSGSTDIGTALRRALGTASDFFISRMLEGIIGPIASQLGAAAANVLGGAAGALGPAGLIVGGITLIGSLIGGLFGGGRSEPPSRAVQRDSYGPSSVSTRIETAINVYLEGSLENPRTRAEMEALAERVTIRVLERLRMV